MNAPEQNSGNALNHDRADKTPSFEELIEGITPENCHGEVDWGVPAGNEAW